MLFKWRSLIIRWAVVPLGTVAAVHYGLDLYRDRWSRQSCYKDSIKILEEHEPAMQKLGSPLKFKTKLSIYKNSLDEYAGDCQLSIPIDGALSKGMLYVVAKRHSVSKDTPPDKFPPWNLRSLYLAVVEEKQIFQIYGPMIDTRMPQLDNPFYIPDQTVDNLKTDDKTEDNSKSDNKSKK